MRFAEIEPRFTEREYLALEAVAERGHEYIGGDILGRPGEEFIHNQIVTNVLFQLAVGVQHRGGRVVGCTQRVLVPALREYFYPDGVMTCLEPALVDPAPESLTNPQVLAEVLSPSTEKVDRGEKRNAYLTIPTLDDYLVVSSSRRQVEHHQKTEANTWVVRISQGGSFKLVNGVELELDKLYVRTGL